MHYVDMSTVIEVENLSKLYRLGIISTRTIAQDVNRFVAKLLKKENPDFRIGELNNRQLNGSSQFVWALNDISFQVKQGDVMAIIGKNGAGKSTLLKILSRVTTPSKGKVRLKGRVASLLEVGTGFHPELTGRENIFLNGSILGMTKNEIKLKFDNIVEFSGIGNYIDTPVKRYSSGMHVRLAFAVAAHLDPEILIVDEVLAVGDAEFQKKCIGKMHDVSATEGRTVLFVSHNMSAIKNLCTKGILLEYGRKVFDGSAEDAIRKYLSSTGAGGNNLAERSDRTGSGGLKFTELNLRNQKDEIVTQVISGEPLKIQMSYVCNQKLKGNVIISVAIQDGYGNNKAMFVTDEMGIKFENIPEAGKIILEIPQIMLRADNYFIRLFASYNTTGANDILDSIENAGELRVLQGDFWKSGKTNREGSFGLMNGKFFQASK